MTTSTKNHVYLRFTCFIKLKPANYLIKRTHIFQLIQIIENEPSKNRFFTRQTARKVVAAKKDAKDSETIDDWKEKDVFLNSWISSTLTKKKHAPNCGLLNCQGDVKIFVIKHIYKHQKQIIF